MGSLKHLNKYLFKYKYRLLLGAVFEPVACNMHVDGNIIFQKGNDRDPRDP